MRKDLDEGMDLLRLENYILPCIQDFEAFLKYIGEERPVLSPKRGVLGKKHSFNLNSRLNYKRDVSAPYYQQDHYFIIDLMFSLAINSRLVIVVNDEKGKSYFDKTVRAESFMKLNNFEKYVFLLESYWSRYDFDLKVPKWWGMKSLYNLLIVIGNGKPNERISKNFITDILFGKVVFFLHHLNYFGLCSLELIDGAKNRYDYLVEAVVPNEFGVMICRQLIEKAMIFWNTEDTNVLMDHTGVKKTKNVDKGLFFIIAKVFPGNIVQKTIEDEVQIDNKGVYTFKVSLCKTIWRKIRMSHKSDFEDLHLAIQEAFNFDNDHLYEFYIGGNRRTANIIYTGHPYGGIEDDVSMDEANLYKGQKIKYIFDFGDMWEFDIIVIDIDKNVPIPIKPEIIESKGEAPEQYPSWE